MFVLVMKFIVAMDLLMNTGDSGDSSGDRVSTMGDYNEHKSLPIASFMNSQNQVGSIEPSIAMTWLNSAQLSLCQLW